MRANTRAVGTARSWLFWLHLVTGWSTFAFVLLIASGVVLWIPRRFSRAALLRSVTPVWASTQKARYFNWHTVLGFWCAPVLMVLALSGLVLAFPWANRLLQEAAGTPLPPVAARPEMGGAPREAAVHQAAARTAVPDYRRADAASDMAARQLPTWRTIALRIQSRGSAPLSFTITDATHWNRFARSQLTTSSATGAVVRWEPYTDISRGQRWRGWARFSHTGELGGFVGQIVAGVASAAAAVLAWTGISLAIRRLARPRRVTRDAARAA